MTTDRLTRVREGRIVAGVCTGLGRRTGIDPLVFRITFAILVFATWVAIPLYLVAVLLMADEQGGPGPIEKASHRLLDGSAVLALLGVVLGTGVLLGLTGQSLLHSLGGDALAALVIIALIVLTAQAKGADLVAAARTLPDRLRGEPLPMTHQTPTASSGHPENLQVEWIDLATLKPIVVEIPRPDRGPSPTPPPAPPPVPPPAAPKPPSRRRKASMLTWLTLTAAAAAAAVSASLSGHLSEPAAIQVPLATALAVVAFGLIIGTWIERPNGLAAVGVLLSVALLASPGIGDAQTGGRVGDVIWRPVDPNSSQPYRILAGDGRLDLTALALENGGRYRVDAELGLGDLRIILPAHAQVELNLSIGLGDITVEKRISSGPRARVVQTLPGSGPNPPVLELHVKGRLGDLEVARGHA